MGKKKIIPICIGLLICIVFIAAILNLHAAKEKSALTANSEIAVTINNQVANKITKEDISSLEPETFTASLKSSGNDPVDVQYTGVPMASILEEKNISLDEHQTVTMGSLDGYTVQLKASEVLDKENVWLVFEQDGKELDSRSGPYMVVIRKDSFSQRWSKQLCEITLDE